MVGDMATASVPGQFDLVYLVFNTIGNLRTQAEQLRGHCGFDTLDMAAPQGTSHHFTREPDGSWRRGESNFRCIWPSECDLMAQLAGLEPAGRWADWHRAECTGDSPSHVSVWRKPVE